MGTTTGLQNWTSTQEWWFFELWKFLLKKGVTWILIRRLRGTEKRWARGWQSRGACTWPSCLPGAHAHSAPSLQQDRYCWLVLNEVLVKRAENDSPYCFSWLGMSICYLTSIPVLLICTFTTVFTNSSKYGTLQLSCLIFYSLLSTWCRVSFMRKCWRGARITLRTEVSSQEINKNLH